MASTLDRIERSVLLKAPRSRVWRAISDAEEFGSWFGVSYRGQTIAAGKTLRGPVSNPGYEHIYMEIIIERFEPEHLLSWRWHPAAIDPDVDYSAEPMTLVVFTLTDAEGGTRITVVESGLQGIPELRRAQVLRLNTEGWEQQMVKLKAYVDNK